MTFTEDIVLVLYIMEFKDTIEAFSRLGTFLVEIAGKKKTAGSFSSSCFEKFDGIILQSFYQNGWFTEKNVRYALRSLGDALKKESIKKWLSPYPEINKLPRNKQGRPATVGVIMAGNIPVVGFHDLSCVLISGNNFKGKLSSADRLLLPAIAEVLTDIEPRFRERISFTENKLENCDAIIATGSNNSAKYFEYYFSKYPHIIRKNRNSVAVLGGNETKDELKKLGNDIFSYFGLGCRNVSKLFVPAGYDFNDFFAAIYDHKTVLENNKYANNYEYNRTIYLMNNSKLLDNNFVLLKEDNSLHSPVAVVNFEYYSSEEKLSERLRLEEENIQCIVSSSKNIPAAIPFGKTQQPSLWDYADGVDTLRFLIDLR